MERVSLLKSWDLTLEELIDLYNELPYVEDLCEQLSCKIRVLQKYLCQQGGIKRLRHRPKKRKETGQFALWVNSHPDVLLPRSISEISKISGCTPSVVKSYFYVRQTRIFKLVINNIVPFLKKHPILTDLNGRPYPSKIFKRFIVKVDKYTFKILLIGLVGGNPENKKYFSFKQEDFYTL